MNWVKDFFKLWIMHLRLGAPPIMRIWMWTLTQWSKVYLHCIVLQNVTQPTRLMTTSLLTPGSINLSQGACCASKQLIKPVGQQEFWRLWADKFPPYFASFQAHLLSFCMVVFMGRYMFQHTSVYVHLVIYLHVVGVLSQPVPYMLQHKD